MIPQGAELICMISTKGKTKEQFIKEVIETHRKIWGKRAMNTSFDTLFGKPKHI